MFKLATMAQEQQEQKIETRAAVECISSLTIVATVVAVLAVLIATAVYAQDKYSLKSPSGIAFSDFRGYEDWSVSLRPGPTKCSRSSSLTRP
jgi:hypothetical protein